MTTKEVPIVTASIVTELIGWAGISLSVSLVAFYLLNESWRHDE